MSLIVTIGGTAVTGRLTGPLTVDAVAGAARLVDFAFLPASAMALRGATIVIADGATTLFTGRVERAPVDPVTGVVSVRGTDRLQEYCANMTESAILAAVTGGRYSVHLHGVRASGFEQMEDVVSTVLGDFDLTPAGVGRYTAWNTSGALAATYTTYVDKTLSMQTPDLSSLINHVSVSLEARWARRHHIEHECSWSTEGDWCDWEIDQYTLPERSEIEQAASGGNWRIKTRADGISTAIHQSGIETTGHHASGVSICRNGIVWTLTEAGMNTCLSAAWTVATRYVQWIRETYALTVAIASPNPQTSAEHSWRIDQDAGDTWDDSADTSVPTAAINMATGRWRWDQRDSEEIENALHAAIGTAARDIVAAHREWELTFTQPIDPARDVGQRIRLVCSDGDWTGQITRVQHQYTVCGAETTTITMALGGGSIGGYTLPDAPDSTGGYTAIPASSSFPTHIGSDEASPDYDQEWLGWTGNYVGVDHGTPTETQIYPEAFKVEYPEIPQDHRDEKSYSATPLAVTITVIAPD